MLSQPLALRTSTSLNKSVTVLSWIGANLGSYCYTQWTVLIVVGLLIWLLLLLTYTIHPNVIQWLFQTFKHCANFLVSGWNVLQDPIGHQCFLWSSCRAALITLSQSQLFNIQLCHPLLTWQCQHKSKSFSQMDSMNTCPTRVANALEVCLSPYHNLWPFTQGQSSTHRPVLYCSQSLHFPERSV